MVHVLICLAVMGAVPRDDNDMIGSPGTETAVGHSGNGSQLSRSALLFSDPGL